MDIISLLDKYPALCKLKLLGVSLHPDKAVFQFSLLFLGMSTSCKSILDHIAEYLRFISDAQSFWFTLNTSYGHGFHLTHRFRLEPNDYKVLLVVASLASLGAVFIKKYFNYRTNQKKVPRGFFPKPELTGVQGPKRRKKTQLDRCRRSPPLAFFSSMPSSSKSTPLTSIA